MPRYSEEFKAQALEMVESGLSYKEVARKLGASDTVVGNWANPGRRAKAVEATKEWRRQNPDLNRAASRKWFEGNREQVLERHREYRKENKERIRRWQAEYRDKNREERNRQSLAYARANREKMRRLNSEYVRNNPDKNSAKAARQRTMRRSVPQPHSIIERLMVANYYEDAARLSRGTGVPHHVDHIWPIKRGGPHLPWNLRVILGSENCRKGARLEG